MQALSDRPSSYSYFDMDPESDLIEENSEWTSSILPSKEDNIRIIRLANQKTNLFKILQQYNVKFEIRHSASGWTHVSNCPLPDHHDSSPSFNYNSKEDRFNCFGCQSFGQAVEFLHQVQKRPKTVIAKELLQNKNLDFSELETSNQDQVSDLLINFSFYVRTVLERTQNLAMIEAITWQLDLYLYKSYPKGKVSLAELQARINKCKERLQLL